MGKVLAMHVPGFHMGDSSNPSSRTSHPAPCLWHGEAVVDGPKPSCVGDLQAALASWLEMSSAQAIVSTWGVNQQMEGYPLSLLLSV